MVEPTVLDSSGEPSPPTHQARRTQTLKRIARWLRLFLRPDLILAVLALLVIAGQLVVMNRQTTIADKQAAIAQRQFILADTQQTLATRPNVEAAECSKHHGNSRTKDRTRLWIF